MSKTTYYRQCKMQKNNSFQVSWIPEQFARKGKVIKLLEDSGWDDGWIVIEVGPYRHSEKDLPDSHDEIKSHRKNTGDSMPKEKK